MRQLSPCGQSSLESELLSICKHVLGLRGSVAQASLLDELGLQPLQIIWLQACVKFSATACSASRGNPLLWEAMRANVELSMDCHKAWCAWLAWFLKCIGVLSCEEMDMCNPPDLDMVAQAVLLWAGSCRQQLLHAGATVQNTYQNTGTCNAFAPRRWVKSLDHIHICVLDCAFHILWCLAWFGSASVATTWGWNLAGIKEWFGLRVAASDVQLWECAIFLWMTKPIFSFRVQLPLWLSGNVDLHNCHFRRCRISCAVMMCTGWHCLCTSA
jgi:hypothetical protein